MQTIVEKIKTLLSDKNLATFYDLIKNESLENPTEDLFFTLEAFHLSIEKEKKEELTSLYDTFLFEIKRNLYYRKEIFSFKVDKEDNKEEHQIKVVSIPRTLKTLLEKFSENDVLNFVIKQVIAHKCFSECRQAVKNGKPLEVWTFSLPRERKATPKVSKELASKLQGLSPEKLEQLLNLLND